MNIYLLGLMSFFALTSHLLGSCQTNHAKKEAVTNQSQTSPTPATAIHQPVIQNIGSGEARDLITNTKNLIILDVRTPMEVASGSISGAQNIDLNNPDFLSKIATLDKNQPTLVYCRTGLRSQRACSIMAEQGFTNLYNLNGGYLAWGNK